MSISDKQRTANRANAAKSTGPRTPEGKRKSSQNALKHGVLAKAILIEGECEQGFLNLCKACELEYNPETPTEHALVNKAVTAHWRALRAASMEAAAITREMQLQAQSTEHEDETTRAMLAVKALNETFDLQHRHAIRDPIRLRDKKMNLNKRTHSNEGAKGLIAPTLIAKATEDPSKAT